MRGRYGNNIGVRAHCVQCILYYGFEPRVVHCNIARIPLWYKIIIVNIIIVTRSGQSGGQ